MRKPDNRGNRAMGVEMVSKLLRDVAENALKLMEADGVYIFLCDEETGELGLGVGVWASGKEELPTDTLRKDSLAARVAATGLPIFLDDIESYPHPPPEARRWGLRAIACLPLKREGAVLGVLSVVYRAPHAFDDADLRLLASFASQAAVAAENAQLYADLEAKANELALLLKVANTLSSSLTLPQTLNTLAEEVVSSLDITLCSIALLENDSLSIQAAFAIRSLNWNPPIGKSFPLSSLPTLQRAISSNRPIPFRQDDPASALPQHELEALLTKGISSGLILPLSTAGRTLGTISLGEMRRWQRAAFTPHRINLCQAMARQAALAIERAQLYQKTIEEKQRTETILREASAGLLTLDSNLLVSSLNPTAEAILGLKAHQLIGKPLPSLFTQQPSPLDLAIQSHKRIPPTETTIASPKGPKDLLLAVAPLPDGFLLSFSDITRLKEIDRLKSNIVANVSHELRTPLASIKAYTEILLEGLEEDDPSLRHKFLSIINQETDRLAELIDNLLDLSRLEAGRFQVTRQPLSLSQLVQEAVSSLSIQAQRRNISIHTDIPPNLPPLHADRELILTMIKNLLSNAIKFSHQGGRVDIVAKREQGHLALSFVDRGIGIPKEDLPHIFEKFYRVRSTTESGITGSGLGLTLAKQAAEAHGGTIEVQSQLGKGSTFTVILPLPRSEESEHE